jgi:hypothetical protein
MVARQGVHHGDAHAVQATRHLVGVLVELTARVELGHDDLGGRDALAGMDVGGNAAAVIRDRHGAVGIEGHGHFRGVAGQRLVDGVVHHLVDHVMEARAVIGVADIHARPLADGIEALEDLDGFGAIGIGIHVRCGFGHKGSFDRGLVARQVSGLRAGVFDSSDQLFRDDCLKFHPHAPTRA